MVTMGTFHSICAKILRSEIHNLGYTSEFSIFDTQDQVSLIKVLLEPMDFPKKLYHTKRFKI
jgi:Superfamily I DNA and RNA helicases